MNKRPNCTELIQDEAIFCPTVSTIPVCLYPLPGGTHAQGRSHVSSKRRPQALIRVFRAAWSRDPEGRPSAKENVP